MNRAKATKNDEFYTQLPDIEKEVGNYMRHFEGKSVFCNCDDPDWSNFWIFFKMHFNHYKMKHLVATHYDPDGKPSYKLEYTGKGRPRKTKLKEDGDFRSDECVELMKEADIVVTNPPFSLIIPYILQLTGNKKKFLVIGNINSLGNKEFMPLVLKGKFWLGYHSGMAFKLPDDKGFAKMGFSCWFTNLQHKRLNEEMILTALYDPKKYPKYENYDAIEVGKIRDIPKDYEGEMGVPVSFMKEYNPKQFEIVGFDRGVLPGGAGRFIVNGRESYVRMVIRHKRSKK